MFDPTSYMDNTEGFNPELYTYEPALRQAGSLYKL